MKMLVLNPVLSSLFISIPSFFFLHVLMKQLVHQVCGQLSLKIDLCFAYTWSSHPLKRIEKSSTFYVNMVHVVSTDELDIIKPL